MACTLSQGGASGSRQRRLCGDDKPCLPDLCCSNRSTQFGKMGAEKLPSFVVRVATQGTRHRSARLSESMGDIKSKPRLIDLDVGRRQPGSAIDEIIPQLQVARFEWIVGRSLCLRGARGRFLSAPCISRSRCQPNGAGGDQRRRPKASAPSHSTGLHVIGLMGMFPPRNFPTVSLS